MAVERVYYDKILKLEKIICALTEYYRLCPGCYRNMNGDKCTKCQEYYLDCPCTPLTPEQLVEGESD